MSRRETARELAQEKAAEKASDEHRAALLSILARVSQRIQAEQTGQAEYVQKLRALNVTWEEIAAALGTTRQGAWQRFSGLRKH